MPTPKPKPSAGRPLSALWQQLWRASPGSPSGAGGRLVLPVWWRRWVLVVGTLGMVTTAAAVGWSLTSPGGRTGGRKGFRAVPVVLTVDTNFPVSATVHHQRYEERSPQDMAELLGHTPNLRDVEGVHVGDRIVLENPVQGISYAQVIEYGQPGERILLRKEFRTGHVHFRFRKEDAQGLGIYRNQTQLAPYVPDVKIELVEGSHLLEIRGPRLRRPAKVAVEVVAGETRFVDPPRLELDP